MRHKRDAGVPGDGLDGMKSKSAGVYRAGRIDTASVRENGKWLFDPERSIDSLAFQSIINIWPG